MPDENVSDATTIITKTFEGLDKLSDRLQKIPSSSEKKTKKLIMMFKDDVFKEPAEFLSTLSALSEEIGYAYHVVLTIELERQRIPAKASDLLELLPKTQSPNQPIVLQPNAPQLGVLSGYWYYKAAAEIGKSVRKDAAHEEFPQISTSKEVVDILEFGRQLIPEFNRVQEFYQKCLDILYFFKDDDTRERLQCELRKHMNKLAGIIRAFSRTITEYRLDLIGKEKSEIAQAALALQMAETNALGGIPMSKLYQMLRESQGPQSAGG